MRIVSGRRGWLKLSSGSISKRSIRPDRRFRLNKAPCCSDKYRGDDIIDDKGSTVGLNEHRYSFG